MQFLFPENFQLLCFHPSFLQADGLDIPEQPVWVRLDMDSYMRIINNLIQNVIAHSHADKIKIVLSKKENNMELLLADNGVGIEKEDLKHIFERLYKCDKGRSEKGSGLGLSIVHQLVEKPTAFSW